MASKELFYWVAKIGSTISRAHADADFGKRHPEHDWKKAKTFEESKIKAENLRKKK